MGREIYKPESGRGIFGEGKVRSEWAYMGGFCCCSSPLPAVILSDTSVVFEKIGDTTRQTRSP